MRNELLKGNDVPIVFPTVLWSSHQEQLLLASALPVTRAGAGASRIVATLSSALLLVLLFRRGDMADSPPFHGSIAAAAGSPLRASRGSDLEVDWAIEDWRCGLRGVVMRWWPQVLAMLGVPFRKAVLILLGVWTFLFFLGQFIYSPLLPVWSMYWIDCDWLVVVLMHCTMGVVWSAYGGLVGWWCPSLCSQEGSDQRGTLSKGAELHPAELEQSGMCEEGSEACSGLPSFHNWDCDWK